MGVEILCLHCHEPSMWDTSASWAATYLLAMLLLHAVGRVRRFRTWVEDVELLAVSVAVPVTVGLVAGVLSEFPAYLPVALGAASGATPFGILAIADLGEAARPETELSLAVRGAGSRRANGFRTAGA